jgi:hypothetical protein
MLTLVDEFGLTPVSRAKILRKKEAAARKMRSKMKVVQSETDKTGG